MNTFLASIQRVLGYARFNAVGPRRPVDGQPMEWQCDAAGNVFVTIAGGQLPQPAPLPPPVLAGDTRGPIAATVTERLRGALVPPAPARSDIGKFFAAVAPNQYGLVDPPPPSVAMQAGGDLRGTATEQFVQQLTGPAGGGVLPVLAALGGGADGFRLATALYDTGAGKIIGLDPRKPVAIIRNLSLPQYPGPYTLTLVLDGAPGATYFVHNDSPQDVIELRHRGGASVQSTIPAFSGAVVVLADIGGTVTPLVLGAAAPSPQPPPSPLGSSVVRVASSDLDQAYGAAAFAVRVYGQYVTVPVVGAMFAANAGDELVIQGTVTLDVGRSSSFGRTMLQVIEGWGTNPRTVMHPEGAAMTTSANPCLFPFAVHHTVQRVGIVYVSLVGTSPGPDPLYVCSPTSLIVTQLRQS